jgi:hypothetical protein
VQCPYCGHLYRTGFLEHVPECAARPDRVEADHIQLERLRAASIRPPGPGAEPLNRPDDAILLGNGDKPSAVASRKRHP